VERLYLHRIAGRSFQIGIRIEKQIEEALPAEEAGVTKRVKPVR
jgi:hypothetical protein